MRRGLLKNEEPMQGTPTTSMASSSTPINRPTCKCGSVMVSFIAKRGLNIGREFWTCANWKSKNTTCDMLIWSDDIKGNHEVVEQVESNVGVAPVGIQSEANSSALAVEIMESGIKKISKLQKKLNAERMRGDAERLKKNIAIFLFFVSFFVNLLLYINFL